MYHTLSDYTHISLTDSVYPLRGKNKQSGSTAYHIFLLKLNYTSGMQTEYQTYATLHVNNPHICTFVEFFSFCRYKSAIAKFRAFCKILRQGNSLDNPDIVPGAQLITPRAQHFSGPHAMIV